MDMFGQTPPSSSYSSYTASSYDMFDTSTMGWSGVIGFTVAILLIGIVLLLFINYTITPIFQLQPGGPGIVRLPFLKNNETFWEPKNPLVTVEDFSYCKVNTAGMSSGWSMSIDICITNPIITTTPGFRLIFNRGGTRVTNGTDGSITSVITGYNIAIGLLKDTNDLLISVMNSNNIPENILITNVPTQQPFRIGVVIMDTAFEVYMNGKLRKTRTIAFGGVRTVSRPAFQGPQGSSMQQMARVGNLLLWTEKVIPSVMRYAEPKLMPALPSDTLTSTAGTCGSSSQTDTIGSLVGDFTGLSTSTISSLKGLDKSTLDSIGPSAMNVPRSLPTISMESLF